MAEKKLSRFSITKHYSSLSNFDTLYLIFVGGKM
jgi:hypothetical protein